MMSKEKIEPAALTQHTSFLGTLFGSPPNIKATQGAIDSITVGKFLDAYGKEADAVKENHIKAQNEFRYKVGSTTILSGLVLVLAIILMLTAPEKYLFEKKDEFDTPFLPVIIYLLRLGCSVGLAVYSLNSAKKELSTIFSSSPSSSQLNVDNQVDIRENLIKKLSSP